MYAVVETGGKQIRVAEGDVLEVERCPGEPGDRITFERVLCLSGGGRLVPGTPTVPGAIVIAEILAQVRGRKIQVFRYKAKTNYRRKTGHRQALTRIRIVAVLEDAVGAPVADAADPEAAGA